MNPLHRRVIAVIVGAAAVLSVSAFALTASLGPDHSQTQTSQKVTRQQVSPARARAELRRARKDLARARADRERANAMQPPTVTVVRTLQQVRSTMPVAGAGRSDDERPAAAPQPSAPASPAPATSAPAPRAHEDDESEYENHDRGEQEHGDEGEHHEEDD